MNEKVIAEMQKRVKDHANLEFEKLKLKCVSMIDKSLSENDVCKNTECLDNMKHAIRDFMHATAGIAVSHGIDPHDMIEETLKIMLTGNEFARKVQRSAEAFKEHENVGFC